MFAVIFSVIFAFASINKRKESVMNNTPNDNNQFDGTGCFFDILGKGCGAIFTLLALAIIGVLICLFL